MIIYKESDGIGSITISSGKGNLLGLDDISSLLNIVEATKNDKAVNGLLIGGDNRCFSTGLDAQGVASNDLNDFFALFDTLLLKLFSYPKPVVVIVDGHSIGGGLLLQCCADYVVASDSDRIKIGLPELKIGLTIDELMLSLLKFNTGKVRVVQELLYSAEYVGVGRSLEIGFVDCVVDSADVANRASLEIKRLVDYYVTAFSATKLRLRSHTIQRMESALNKKCYSIFNELR